MYKSAKKFLLRNKFIRKTVSDYHLKKDYLEKIGIYDDDIYLVSFPRSGSNLVRFLIAYLISTHRFNKEIATFEEARNYMPNLSNNNISIINRLDRPRFIKTHHPISSNFFPKVVYIYRDGRDVYYSYYNWAKKKKIISADMSFYAFLLEHINSNDRWSNHIRSWLYNYPKERIFLIRYEELLHNKFEILRNLSTFINIPASDSTLKRLIAVSDYDIMQKKGNNKEDVVLNKGTSKAYKNQYGPKEKKIFTKYENETLIDLGYISDENW